MADFKHMNMYVLRGKRGAHQGVFIAGSLRAQHRLKV
jgi:hypothetical protein